MNKMMYGHPDPETLPLMDERRRNYTIAKFEETGRLKETHERPFAFMGYTVWKGWLYMPGFDPEEDKIKQIVEQERERLQDKKIRYKVRKELLKEEFKNIEQDTRETISEEVRHEVWRRDGGKCVKCGSQEKLEFDHVLPLSRGGSDTVRNIQILCEKCNREKSNNI